MFIISLIFSLFPAYVWWVKRWDFLKIGLGVSFFILAISFLMPIGSVIGLGIGLMLLPFQGEPSLHPHRSNRIMNRWVKYPLEGLGIWFFYLVFKLLPLSVASNFGGWLGKQIGKRLSSRNRLALKNMAYVMSDRKKDFPTILEKMWENFGRTVGEVAHLKKIGSEYLKIEGLENLKKLQGKPFLIANAHINSIGLISMPFGKVNQPTAVFFRPPNNPLSFPALLKLFGNDLSTVSFLPKGREGMMQAIKSLRDNIPVSITSDLHIDTGDHLKFIGKPAQTSTALSRLSAKFNCPILPIQMVREKGFRHRVIIHSPILPSSGKEEDILLNMQKINDIIGGWVKDYPEQWFWINNRWNL
ncbi:MAG: hypothetical protein JXR30_02460 [Alphaproteobacteria bacterium]|nr:hypothetical protein [Alphaproteobacteria bacterium]